MGTAEQLTHKLMQDKNWCCVTFKSKRDSENNLIWGNRTQWGANKLIYPWSPWSNFKVGVLVISRVLELLFYDLQCESCAIWLCFSDAQRAGKTLVLIQGRAEPAEGWLASVRRQTENNFRDEVSERPAYLHDLHINHPKVLQRERACGPRVFLSRGSARWAALSLLRGVTESAPCNYQPSGHGEI